MSPQLFSAKIDRGKKEELSKVITSTLGNSNLQRREQKNCDSNIILKKSEMSVKKVVSQSDKERKSVNNVYQNPGFGSTLGTKQVTFGK